MNDHRLQKRPRGSNPTRQAVVNAALQVADQVGVEATTIRLVAAAVGVAPMSLYTHFASKEQLLDFMFQEVALRLYADAGQPTWQAALTSLCYQIRNLLLQHPRWVPLLHRPAPPMPVPLRERLLPLMALDGISEDDALTSLTGAGFMSIGWTLGELSFRAPDGQSSLTARFAKLREWSETTAFGDQHPSTQAALAKLQHLDLNRNFDAVVETFIAGLNARFS